LKSFINSKINEGEKKLNHFYGLSASNSAASSTDISAHEEDAKNLYYEI